MPATTDSGLVQVTHELTTLRLPLLMLLGWRQVIPGADGLGCWDHPRDRIRLIHSVARTEGDVWSHVSISRFDRKMPTWEQTRDAFRAVHPNGYGIIVIAPPAKHVNIAEVAHVWSNLSRDYVPDFTHGGASI